MSAGDYFIHPPDFVGQTASLAGVSPPGKANKAESTSSRVDRCMHYAKRLYCRHPITLAFFLRMTAQTQSVLAITEWIGYIAAFLTTSSFIPQVWHIWKTRHTQGISLRMYVFFTCGVALWLIYGLLLSAWPIIIANSVTLLLAGTVLVMKVRNG